MTNRIPEGHLSAELLQALLEGELPDRDSAHAEEHLAGCARCSAELDAWRILIDDLDHLPSLRPEAGFAERVMARVDGLATHVEADLLQEYLEGALGRRRAAAVEAHLAACGGCAAEAEAWGDLMGRLSDLERYAPSPGFAAGVMAGVRLPERVPLAARVRARVASLVPATASEHLGASRLQDFVDGVLSGRRLARVQGHLAGCATCSEEVEAWRGVIARLDALERFEPGPEFSDRVLEGVHVPVPTAVTARTPAWARAQRALLGATAVARRFVPRTREAWAALSGIALTPATVGGLVLYAVFSHPTLTVGSLASFLWWQVTDLASAGWATLSAAILESGELFGAYSIVGSLASAPLAVAGGVLAYSLLSALALRVLYRNILANRPAEGRYARVSAP